MLVYINSIWYIYKQSIVPFAGHVCTLLVFQGELKVGACTPFTLSVSKACVSRGTTNALVDYYDSECVYFARSSFGDIS